MEPAKEKVFYEKWGDLETQNRSLGMIVLGQMVLFFLALALLLILINRPPVVIRVSEVGKAETIESLKINNKITELEVKEFTKAFLKSFRAFSPFTLDEDLAQAFNSMTGRFQKTAEDSLFSSSLLKQVKAKEVASKVEVKEVVIEKETNSILEVRVLGVRRIINLSNENLFTENLFQAELAIRKVPRNVNAYGLLVEDYREVNLKEIKTNQGGMS